MFTDNNEWIKSIEITFITDDYFSTSQMIIKFTFGLAELHNQFEQEFLTDIIENKFLQFSVSEIGITYY